MIRGYFQSLKYFEEVQDDIIDMFSPTNEVKKEIYKKYGDITKRVSIHIRRGDYLKFPDIHPVCNENYYKNAISNFKNNSFIIFSDDIGWVENNFKDISKNLDNSKKNALINIKKESSILDYLKKIHN